MVQLRPPFFCFSYWLINSSQSLRFEDAQIFHILHFQSPCFTCVSCYRFYYCFLYSFSCCRRDKYSIRKYRKFFNEQKTLAGTMESLFQFFNGMITYSFSFLLSCFVLVISMYLVLPLFTFKPFFLLFYLVVYYLQSLFCSCWYHHIIHICLILTSFVIYVSSWFYVYLSCTSQRPFFIVALTEWLTLLFFQRKATAVPLRKEKIILFSKTMLGSIMRANFKLQTSRHPHDYACGHVQ